MTAINHRSFRRKHCWPVARFCPHHADEVLGATELARTNGGSALSEPSSEYWPTDRDRYFTNGVLRSVPNEQSFDCTRTDPRAAIQEDARYAPAEKADVIWPKDILCVLDGLGRLPLGLDFRRVYPLVPVAAGQIDHAAPDTWFREAVRVPAGSRREERPVRHIVGGRE